MFSRVSLILFFLWNFNRNDAVNHWELTSDGKIQPQVSQNKPSAWLTFNRRLANDLLTRKQSNVFIVLQVDSIFYLRRPDDLAAFLNQFDYRQTITSINAQLLAMQMEITDKVQQSTYFQVEIMSHTDCLIYYSIKEEELYSSLKDKKYFNRINTKRMTSKSTGTRIADNYPFCEDVPFSLSCFEHLPSMINRKRLVMSPELPLHSDEFGVLRDSFVKMVTLGLKHEPLSWKYPVLGSYYWRARGNTKRAIECARRAIYLAPRKYLDIPFLSLGTILQRANQSQDALVVMQAAAKHAVDVFENQIGLGNALFLTSDFSNALKSYKNAVTLDEQFAMRYEFMLKSINCFKTIKQKLNEFQNQVQEIFGLLEKYKSNQTKLEDYLNRVLSEQVPIGKRLADPSFDIYSHHLLHRGQYCKPKESPDSKEPVLYCDFYTDLQSQLQKEDLIVDIVHHFADAAPKFIENFSLGIYRQLDIENYNETSGDNSNYVSTSKTHTTNRSNQNENGSTKTTSPTTHSTRKENQSQAVS